MTMLSNLLIRAEREQFSDSISIRIASPHNDGSRYVAQPVSFASVDIGSFVAPCMSLSTTDAQKLMDELWQVGLRPSEGTGSAGSLAATQKHLADMRTIAFNALKIKASKP